MSKNDKFPKRTLSFQHVIKLDTTLGNLKFTNKGTIDPVFGMPIPAVMLNDDIKASTEYSEYLKKATGGSTPVVKGGKGLLSKKGVKIAVEQLRIPKRRLSKTVTEEVDESEQMDDLCDSKETEEEEVLSLIKKRSIGVAIVGYEESTKSGKEDFYVQQRSKGLGEGFGITPEVPDELVHKSSNEGAGVNPEVPDESNSSSSNSSSDYEVVVEDISSDEDEVTKKADNAKTANTEKDTEGQVANEQVAEKQARVEEQKVNYFDILKDPVEPEVHSMVDVPIKHAIPDALRPSLIDTTVTLIPDTTTNDDESLENRVYRLERQVNAISKFNIQEAVDKSVEARLKHIDLSKDVPDFDKIKQEKAAKQSMPKHS
ncbi:hypothetical protein Tco_0193999 [Tanacetum coccineum]